jgi:hypothetical protein
MRYFLVIFILLFIIVQFHTAQDTLLFQGQLSGWLNYNARADFPVYGGIRYIPALNYNINTRQDRLIDFEGSVNIYGTTGIHPFDSIDADGGIKPYRIWARYSSDQFEIRMGLQKINFGSASMLRPLMWFDQLDPRDPLQLTDGVWGILGRYYFLNNANLWVWGLYGNEGPKTWETGTTSHKFPELGGRLQMPVPNGEAAVSYHYRKADTRNIGENIPSFESVAENRVGIDAKWDLKIGLWFEGSWIGKSRNTGMFTNQEMMNLGADFTFGLGNGLNVVVEQLLVSYDEKAFAFSNAFSFTGSSFSYPIGLFDNFSAILFYDWSNHTLYNFLNWKRQFNKLSLYLMAYWNPEDYRMPQQTDSGELFSGKGLQLMLVFNY